MTDDTKKKGRAPYEVDVGPVVRRPGYVLACPSCESTDIMEVVYGSPTVEGWEMIERGEFAAGGNFPWPDSPAWKCRQCRNEFGRLGDTHPEFWKGRNDK